MQIAKRLAILAGALSLCASAAQAAVSYQFNVDTSSLAGTDGFIEFQMGNNAFGPFQSLTATIRDFQTDGVLSPLDPHATLDPFGTPEVLGHASGVLSGAVSLFDIGDTQTSDYLHGFTFGNTLSFRLTLSGPAVDAPACAAFGGCEIHFVGLGLLDGGLNYLLNDPLNPDPLSALIGLLAVDDRGAVTAIAFGGPDGASSAVSVASVPEPQAWALMLMGFAGLGVALRRGRLQGGGAPSFS